MISPVFSVLLAVQSDYTGKNTRQPHGPSAHMVYLRPHQKMRFNMVPEWNVHNENGTVRICRPYFSIHTQLSFLTHLEKTCFKFLGENPHHISSFPVHHVHPSHRPKVNPWQCRCQCPRFRNLTREECPCRPGRAMDRMGHGRYFINWGIFVETL